MNEHVNGILVGGFKHLLFSIIYGIILPIDVHIFQDGYCTTNQYRLAAQMTRDPWRSDRRFEPLDQQMSTAQSKVDSTEMGTPWFAQSTRCSVGFSMALPD